MLSKCTSKSPQLPFHLFFGIQAYYILFVDSSFITLLTWTHQQTHLTWFQIHLWQTSRGYPEFRVWIWSKHCTFEHCLWILLYVLSFFFVLMPQIPDQRTCTCPPYTVDLLCVILLYLIFFSFNLTLTILDYAIYTTCYKTFPIVGWPFSFKLFYYFSQVNS